MIKRRTPEQWQELFSDYQASGLTQAEFCHQQRLCPKYFSKRRQQFISKLDFGQTSPLST